MSEIKTNYDGSKYTKYSHSAYWMVLHNTHVYNTPYLSSNNHAYSDKQVPSGSSRTYLDSGKAVINGDFWYYFPGFGGWIPWKYKGIQMIKRSGETFYDEYTEKKEDTEGSDTSTKKETPVPNINKYMDTDTTNYKDFIRSKMIIKEDSKKWSYRFNRMQFPDPYKGIGSTREYLFFTKPDLHLLKPGTTSLNSELSNDPFWLEMKHKYLPIVRQLQQSADGTTLPFSPLLSNAAASSLDLPSQSAETSETGATIYGTTIQYREGSFKSDEGYDFSLEFYDSPALETYHYFKMYNEYENLKTLGLVTPPCSANAKLNKYIIGKILHDQMGIYKIIVGDDMETIIHYSYMWGCFPKSVPRDTFKDIESGVIKYSVDWHAQFVDDMQPEILIDFNELSNNYINIADANQISLWNNKINSMNGRWVGCPFITIVKDSTWPTGYRYMLKWYNR